MKLLSTLLFLFFTNWLQAQSIDSTLENANNDLIKEVTEEKDDELPTEFAQLLENKIDINSEEIIALLQLNFLTQRQYQAILNHIKIFGKFIELEELQVINEIDSTTLRSILPYIYITKRSAGIDSRNLLTIRFQQSIKDYVPADYQGDPTKLTIKFRGNDSEKLSYGLLAEKDPGEKVIFGSGKAGFDFYSFYLQIKLNKLLRKVIIGDFGVSFGQGITAWTGGGFSSPENLLSMCKAGRGIYPSASSEENRYLRGVAVELAHKNITGHFWFSHHKIDGNVEEDTITAEKYIRSFITSGYHRSQSEENGYHTINETYTGGNVLTNLKGWRIGITGSLLHYNFPLEKEIRNYNKFDFRGSTNWVSGINFVKTYRNLLSFGEYSMSNNFASAFLLGTIVSIGKTLSTSIVYHNYQPAFHSLKSNPFGSNTLPANESGLYCGINWKINRNWTLHTFINRDEYPYMKFRIDYPSAGIAKGVLFSYQPNKKSIFQLRYKFKQREYNLTSDETGLTKTYSNTIDGLRLSSSVAASDNWDWRTKLEFNRKSTEISDPLYGYYIAQDLFYHSDKKKFTLNFRYAIYWNEDFDLRFYEYENDLPGAYSIPFFDGNGSRLYINTTIKIKNMTLSAKFARSYIIYDDLKTEEIKIIDDVKLQLAVLI